MTPQQITFSDKTLQAVYQRVQTELGPLHQIRSVEPSAYFKSLCESIVSQQLSVKVADVIFARLESLVGEDFVPQSVTKLEHEHLRSVGLSNAKAQYIQNIAHAWETGLINPFSLQELEAEQVIEQLVQIKGVGRWTAEMFLIFTLGRPDIFSVGDYGLKKAISNIYNVPITSKPGVFLEISTAWSPHRSLASRVLWKSLELQPSNYNM